MSFEKEIAEVRQRNGMMPSTKLMGYVYQWEDSADLTDEQNEKAHELMVAEIDRLLPDYAIWSEQWSEITLPIDKVDEFTDTVDWNAVLEKAYGNLLEVIDEKK